MSTELRTAIGEAALDQVLNSLAPLESKDYAHVGIPLSEPELAKLRSEFR
jgi:hypothetical protein